MLDRTTESELLQRGYRAYGKSPFDSEGIEQNYQKRFEDEIGKKYFINAHKYCALIHPYTGERFPESFEFTAQLSTNDLPVNLLFFAGWSVEQVEEYVEKIWKSCNFDYYENFR